MSRQGWSDAARAGAAITASVAPNIRPARKERGIIETLQLGRHAPSGQGGFPRGAGLGGGARGGGEIGLGAGPPRAAFGDGSGMILIAGSIMEWGDPAAAWRARSNRAWPSARS
ncbi:hypothetical protein GCM10010983_04760 [Caulobacter rhizosphaerae]|nr:hypothetical protein GCM10010983_04760 [Caulobacter rhizosphaerae]